MPAPITYVSLTPAQIDGQIVSTLADSDLTSDQKTAEVAALNAIKARLQAGKTYRCPKCNQTGKINSNTQFCDLCDGYQKLEHAPVNSTTWSKGS
jgi:RecJ-like exonuclease